MHAGLLAVLVLLLPLLLVVPLVAGALAWAALRPGEGEPPARARLRRTSGTTVVAATTLVGLLLLLSAGLALGSPELATAVVVVAGLVGLTVLRVGEAVSARPRAVRRTALLVTEPRSPWRTALRVLLLVVAAGLLLVLADALTAGGDAVVTGPNVALLTVVPAGLLVVGTLLAERQAGRASADPRLHPEVAAAGRARAAHRALRAGAASVTAALGLLLLGTELREGAADGEVPATALLVLGVLLILLAAAAALLRPPVLPLRPDEDPVRSASADVAPGGR